MSALKCTFSPGEIALAAATAKTVLQLTAAADHRIRIKRWGVTFDGLAPTNQPVLVTLQRQTTVIGGSPTAITGRKIEPGAAETVQTTGAASAGGSEPTAGDNLKQIEVHPQGGYEEVRESGDEYIVAGAGRIGIVCTAADVVNALPFFEIDE